MTVPPELHHSNLLWNKTSKFKCSKEVQFTSAYTGEKKHSGCGWEGTESELEGASSGATVCPNCGFHGGLVKEDVLPTPVANKSQVSKEGKTHYKHHAGIEHWDFAISNNLGYMEGQITKYITRWKYKNGLEDLLKAQHFLEKLIESERQK